MRAALLIAWSRGVWGVVDAGSLLFYYFNDIPIRSAAVEMAPSAAVRPSSGSASAAVAPSTSSAVVASASALGSVHPTPASPSVRPTPASPSFRPSSAPPSTSVADGMTWAPGPVASASSRPITDSEQRDLLIDVLERHRRTRVPLAIADLLLSIALVAGVAFTVGRRGGGRVWLRQVCVAMMIHAMVDLALTGEERRVYAEGVIDRQVAHLPIDEQKSEREHLLALAAQGNRVILILKLALFGSLAFALGRSSVVLELSPRLLGPPSDPGR